jgi:formylglycine-generating enzyme required for sulfatase activity
VISDSTFEKAHEGRRAALFGKKKRSSVPLVLGLVFVLVLGGVVFYLATQPQRTKQKSSEFRGQSSVTPSDIQHPVSSIQHPEAPPPPSPEAGAVAPAPKQPPTPAAQRPTPVQAQTPAHTPTPAAPPAVAVAPSPSPIAVIQHPVSGMQHLAVDLVSYYDDSKQVNEKIGAADYDAARGQANLLKDKYPDLIATKLANLDRIESLRKRCFERVNSGAVKLTMGDISSRYAFAGEIKSADEGGLNGAIRKRWDSLSREDLLAFYRKASDPKSADDALGLAAFVMEGNVADKGYDAAVDLLGNAKALNAEIAPMMKYIETLKQAVKEYAEAEAKGKEVEGEGRKPALSKAEGAEGEKRQAEEKGPSSPAALPSSQSYDDVYVTTAATGEKIPHPLSKKVKSIVYMQKRVEIPEGMVYVPPGIFTMGEGESEHKVYLDAYFIGKYEVTNAEWKAFIDATAFTPLPPYWKGGQIPQGKENHPVVRVSWEDIQQYCEWVSKETGREVKLPTEAQWEKAARGPKAYIYPWGNQWNPRNCNWQGTWVGKYGLKFNPNEGVASDVWTAFTKSEKYTKEIYQELGGMTLPVGSFPKDRSFYACHDMAGNAYEWCADWFKTDYYKLQDAKRNPEGPNEEEAEEEDFSGKKSKARVLRGGSWYYNSGGCRTVYRTYAYPRAGKGQAWRAARQARP